jgi:hypothetical protein
MDDERKEMQMKMKTMEKSRDEELETMKEILKNKEEQA